MAYAAFFPAFTHSHDSLTDGVHRRPVAGSASDTHGVVYSWRLFTVFSSVRSGKTTFLAWGSARTKLSIRRRAKLPLDNLHLPRDGVASDRMYRRGDHKALDQPE